MGGSAVSSSLPVAFAIRVSASSGRAAAIANKIVGTMITIATTSVISRLMNNRFLAGAISSDSLAL